MSLDKPNEFWWTTAGDTSYLTSSTYTFAVSDGSTFPASQSTPYPTTPFTSAVPTTTYTSPSPTFSNSPSSGLGASATRPGISGVLPNPSAQVAVQSTPICVGDGIDATAGGILATLIVPSVIGLILWLLFAYLRPRFRQVYGVREWFVQQELRPRRLRNTFWAFLTPNVPLVPAVPTDVSAIGKSPASDAHLFPSDEQLAQRTLWIAFLVVLGWSILGLGGALPLYLVNTGCLAHAAPRAVYGGVYSTLQDLSLLRLLQLLDDESGRTSVSVFSVFRRDISTELPRARIRLIILSAFVIVLAVLPALWKILREYGRLVAYRRRWIEVRCEGKEMGWLSAKEAPGLLGKGEKQIKNFILRTGLSSTLDTSGGSGNSSRARRRRGDNPVQEEGATWEVDIQSLFSIGDTHDIAVLIDQRDQILENLEVAETRYINSFRLLTPDPSIASFQRMPQYDDDPTRPRISRPRPLLGSARRKPGRARNPAYASSSFAPSSYMLPSTYYKLQRIQGISGSFSDLNGIREPNLTDSINQRVVGSRFQEVNNRSSAMFGRIPMGSPVRMNKEGILHPVPIPDEPIPDPSRFGPNYSTEFLGHERDDSGETRVGGDEEWTDLVREHNAEHSVYATPDEGPSGYVPEAANGADELGALPPRRRPLIWNYPASQRSTFPMRPTRYSELPPNEVPAPHLRLQARGPFFRPMSGLDHDHLGVIYQDISHWRSQLKALNAQIMAAQNDAYSDIAEGSRIKGWLLVGRGLRFIPGIKLIEGRAKEDVRWDVLQEGGGAGSKILMFTICAVTTIALACSLLAVAGLALGTAPNFYHYLTLFRPLVDRNDWIAGLATGLAAAVAATLFIAIAVLILRRTTRLSSAVSISGLELTSFKVTFWAIVLVGFIVLTAIGALLFAIHAFDIGAQQTATIANGSVYMSALALAIVINMAIIAPGLLLLQPMKLLRTRRAERDAITPRHRFRAIYPSSYDPIFAMACCILAVAIASTFSLLFPLVGPAVVILVLLTLVAHRFLVGYVYGRTRSQTGGLLQIWLLRRFATLTALQPLLLGLILLTRRLWEEGGILCGFAFLNIVFVEVYCSLKLRQPGRKSLRFYCVHNLQCIQGK